MKNKNVVILGAGRIGRALAKVLGKAGNNIELWDVKPGLVRRQKKLVDIIPSADFIFICVPSSALRIAIKSIKPYLSKKAVIVSPSKGIEKGRKKTVDQILTNALPVNQECVVLGGAMMAEDMVRGRMAVGVAAAKKISTATKVKNLFKDTIIIIESSSDFYGVAISGVLKNVYAIALGVADGLRWGSNAKGFLTAQAINEMSGIVKALGGQSNTAFGQAGLGDLITTGFSKDSHNRQYGQKLARTGHCSISAEGCVSVGSVVFLLGKRSKNYPLLVAVNSAVNGRQNVTKAFKQFLAQY
ncbi:hypothetical protein CMO96_02655 [Candidatus Woesebacteria bacterium]|nr:hypothetical protein [Candidatus Woesebacteria bacterium]|tara:strand:+ start:658 stop:1557 length:900 start_codon:yes stop_codon:yes gene_type:complete